MLKVITLKNKKYRNINYGIKKTKNNTGLKKKHSKIYSKHD